MKKVFISTTSFAENDKRPLGLLHQAGIEISFNPHGRKLTEDEIAVFISDADFLIAGTEPLTRKVMASAKKLKIISRCGVGMDNIDMKAAEESGIKVYNTPYGPTLAVAELTVCMIMDLLRRVSLMDREMRRGLWEKSMGNLLHDKRIGIIGYGRIGRKVAEFLGHFGCEIRYTDPCVESCPLGLERTSMESLLSWADIVSIHVSCKGRVLGAAELRLMRKGAWLVNVSRGGAVDEDALYCALKEKHLSGAALDVFEQEPYSGNLKDLDNVILTPHIGSYALEGRVRMELQAVENLLKGLQVVL